MFARVLCRSTSLCTKRCSRALLQGTSISGCKGYHSSTVPDDSREFEEMMCKVKPILQNFIDETQQGDAEFKTLVPKTIDEVSMELSVDKLHWQPRQQPITSSNGYKNGFAKLANGAAKVYNPSDYAEPMSMDEIMEEIQAILKNSARTMRPQYMDKLSTGSDVIGQLSMLILGVINNNVHTFRTSTALTAIEQHVIRELCNIYYGEDSSNADGAFVPGGTYTVFKALRIARDVAFPESLTTGLSVMPVKPIVIASEQLHYSVTLGAQNIGIGAEGVVKVKTKLDGSMDLDDLHRIVNELKSDSTTAPFLISCMAGTTVFGGFDDFHEISEICHKNDLLMHVDGCWGGMAKMSEDKKTYALMDGSENADFIGFDAHKMMGVPLISSAFLVRNKNHLVQSCAPIGADYIFHKELADSPDIGPRTLQCGRHGDALKVYLSWLYYGRSGLSKRVDHCIDNARFLHETLLHDERYEKDFVAVHPEDNPPMFANIAFWHVGKHSGCAHLRKDIINWRKSGYAADFKPEQADSLESMKETMAQSTIGTNNAMKKDGVYAVDYSPMPQLGLPHFFRAVTGNYRMTEDTLIGLLDVISRTSKNLATGKRSAPTETRCGAVHTPTTKLEKATVVS